MNWGGISEADELLETQVKMMKPFNKKIAQAKKSLIAESLFYSNKYEESKKIVSRVFTVEDK